MPISCERFERLIGTKILVVENRRHKLVLLVAPSSSGKTGLLQYLSKNHPGRFEYLNLNRELSVLLKDVAVNERPYKVRELLDKVVSDKQGVLLVDNTEIIFDPELKLDAVKTLERLSRFNIVVASWSGSLKDGVLSYAEPSHKEYYRCQLGESEVIDLTQEML